MIPILQTSTELNETVSQLTKSSIELAEATSNLGALKVIFGIFMIFMILLVLLFFYQLFSMSHKVNDISKAAQACNSFFSGTADQTLGKSQGQILIRRSMNSLSQTIKYQILRIRLENHIELEEATKAKINNVIRHEYIELRNFLSNYLCEGVPMSHVVQEEDIQIIVGFMIEQVYQPKDSFLISNMDQAAQILVDGIKLDYLNRIGVEQV